MDLEENTQLIKQCKQDCNKKRYKVTSKPVESFLNSLMTFGIVLLISLCLILFLNMFGVIKLSQIMNFQQKQVAIYQQPKEHQNIETSDKLAPGAEVEELVPEIIKEESEMEIVQQAEYLQKENEGGDDINQQTDINETQIDDVKNQSFLEENKTPDQINDNKDIEKEMGVEKAWTENISLVGQSQNTDINEYIAQNQIKEDQTQDVLKIKYSDTSSFSQFIDKVNTIKDQLDKNEGNLSFLETNKDDGNIDLHLEILPEFVHILSKNQNDQY